jgi:phage-related protein
MANLTEDEKLELGIYIEKVIREELQKIISNEAKKISREIESRVNLETNINTLTNRILSKSKINGFVDSISKTMEIYLNDLDDIKIFRDNIRREIIASLAEYKENLMKKTAEKTETIIESQRDSIRD